MFSCLDWKIVTLEGFQGGEVFRHQLERASTGFQLWTTSCMELECKKTQKPEQAPYESSQHTHLQRLDLVLALNTMFETNSFLDWNLDS